MGKTNLALAKKLNTAATIVSVIVIALVVAMRSIHFETGIDFSFLPPFHATLNALAAVALMASFYFIKNKNIEAHQKANFLALGLSVLFLLSYVVYHTTTEATKFGGEGNIRYVYFFLLITHVILAAVILPFILFTFIRAYTGQIEKHRKMAKWVYPLWLYVAITGPICYLMLRPYY
jgi:putative membrane protein